jgi:hypothetical protein
MLALFVNSVALAANPSQTSSPEPLLPTNNFILENQAYGKITALGLNEITYKNSKGKVFGLVVNSNTRYYSIDGTSLTFADLLIGRWIDALVMPAAGGKKLAREVVMFQAGFNSKTINLRTSGKVTSVNVNRNTFTLKTLNGSVQVIRLNDNSLMVGEVGSLGALKPRMLVWVAVKRSATGFLGRVVFTGQPETKVNGTVSAIDLSGQTFTLTLRNGTATVFAVNQDTFFRGGSVHSLAELRIGMKEYVVARQVGTDQWLAMLVSTWAPTTLFMEDDFEGDF